MYNINDPVHQNKQLRSLQQHVDLEEAIVRTLSARCKFRFGLDLKKKKKKNKKVLYPCAQFTEVWLYIRNTS